MSGRRENTFCIPLPSFNINFLYDDKLPATWVGGIFINGTAELVATPGYGYGLWWGLVFPVTSGLGLAFGKTLFYIHCKLYTSFTLFY